MHGQPNQPRFIRRIKRKNKLKTKKIAHLKNTENTKKQRQAVIQNKTGQTKPQKDQFTSNHYNQQKQTANQVNIHDFRIFQRTIPNGSQNAFESLFALLNKHGSANFEKLLLTKLN
jgi:hypothetical protein